MTLRLITIGLSLLQMLPDNSSVKNVSKLALILARETLVALAGSAVLCDDAAAGRAVSYGSLHICEHALRVRREKRVVFLYFTLLSFFLSISETLFGSFSLVF